MATILAPETLPLTEAREECAAALMKANAHIDTNGLPGTFTETGWIPPDEPLAYDVWCVAVLRVAYAFQSIHWNLGDLLNYGGIVYGETYAQVSAWSGVSVNTLYRDGWVTRSVPKEIRRPPDVVPFSTHIPVAAARYSVEDKDLWLEIVADEDWSGDDLKDALAKAALAGTTAPGNFIYENKIGDDGDEADEPEDEAQERAPEQPDEPVTAVVDDDPLPDAREPENEPVVEILDPNEVKMVTCPECGHHFATGQIYREVKHE